MVYQGFSERYTINDLKFKQTEKMYDTHSFKNIILVYYLITF